MSVPGGRSPGRFTPSSAKFGHQMSVLGGRSAKFELALTTRCQYQGVGLLADLPLDLSNLATRCQYWGVDLPADLGVDLPNLNSS